MTSHRAAQLAARARSTGDHLNNVRKITPGGAVKTLRDIRNESPFIKPVAVAVDDKDQIYVADEDGFRIVAGKPTK
jgi:NHL repeat